MREIKFRVWDHKTKWMYPVQRMDWQSPWGTLTDMEGADPKHPESDYEGNVFFRGTPDKVTCKKGELPYKRYELMQYTGLKDAKGREFYEGDIYGKPGYWNYYIGWEDGAFVAIPCDPVQKINWKWFRVTQESLEGFEIIGHIYESEVQP